MNSTQGDFPCHGVEYRIQTPWEESTQTVLLRLAYPVPQSLANFAVDRRMEEV